jgi:ATP-dependent DNA helicase RecQ
MGQVIDVLRGRPTEKVTSRRHDELSTFGLLEDATVPELRGYIEQLAEQGLLCQGGDRRYPVLQVTPEGRRLLKAEAECVLYRHRVPEKKKHKRLPREKAGVSWEGVDRSLFEELRRLRREIAEERQVPPYVIFHDSVLRQLARERPASPEELLDLHGVGAKKAEDFGPRFLELVAAHPAPASTPAQNEEVRT